MKAKQAKEPQWQQGTNSYSEAPSSSSGMALQLLNPALRNVLENLSVPCRPATRQNHTAPEEAVNSDTGPGHGSNKMYPFSPALYNSLSNPAWHLQPAGNMDVYITVHV